MGRVNLVLALVLAVALGLVLASCGSGDGAQTEAATPRTLDTSGGLSADAASTGDAIPLTDALRLDPLDPGTYVTTLTHRPITFTVDEGWYQFLQSSGILGLSLVPNGPESSDAPFLAVGFMEGDGVQAYEDPLVRESDLVSVPEDLSGWIQGLPGLILSDPEPVTLAGLDGLRFDLELEDVAPPDGLYVFRDESGPFGPNRDSRGSWFVFEEDRVLVVIDALSASSLDEFLPRAQAVLDTMKIG